MLKVENISIAYGDVKVVEDVSFEVKEKEIVAIIGANGAGKTTILRSISRIIPILSGEIYFKGRPLSKEKPHKLIQYGIAHIPEARRLFTEMTVEENLIMGSLIGEAKRKRNDTMEFVYSIFPRLKERRKQIAGTLSGGEQQMLAIGRGLMSLPELLIFDEPSLGLAPLLVKEIFRVIQTLNQQGKTILIVEQNVHLTLQIASRGYVLELGKITLEDKAENLLNNSYIKKAYLGI